MVDYVRKSVYPGPDRGATSDEIIAIEAELGVTFPEPLRQGCATAGDASIFKGGKDCSQAVTGPANQGGREVGFFQNLEPLGRIPRQASDLRERVDDVYERKIPDVIPFAGLGGDGWGPSKSV